MTPSGTSGPTASVRIPWQNETMSAVRVAIAGSSGSIGTQTLDVIRAEAGEYEVVGLGVASSVDVLIEQALEFRPKVVAVADPAARAGWPTRCRSPT